MITVLYSECYQIVLHSSLEVKADHRMHRKC